MKIGNSLFCYTFLYEIPVNIRYFKKILDLFKSYVIKTTVSIWLDCSLSMTDTPVHVRKHIHVPFNDRSKLSLKSI